MFNIFLSSPILALPLFLLVPIRTALSVYLAVLVATGCVCFKIIAAMKSKVQT